MVEPSSDTEAVVSGEHADGSEHPTEICRMLESSSA